MATMVERICKLSSCSKPFLAKASDVARGWGLYCSKSCKATKQEKTTHQYRNLLRNNGVNPGGLRMYRTETAEERRQREEDEAFDAGMCANEAGWDGHKNAF